MNLCRHCEVEVEEDARYCPLCRKPLQPGVEDEERESGEASRDPQEANRRIHRWVAEILSIVAVTSGLVAFTADFVPDMSLSWSRYPLSSIAFSWLSVVLLTAFARRAWVYLPAEIAATCLFLFALDRFTAGPAWFLPLALPMTLLIGTILVVALAIGRKAGLSPFAKIAAVMLAAGTFVVGLELLLNRFRDHHWFVSWSAVVFACMLPPALMLLYLRKWLRARQGEIRKLLHL